MPLDWQILSHTGILTFKGLGRLQGFTLRICLVFGSLGRRKMQTRKFSVCLTSEQGQEAGAQLYGTESLRTVDSWGARRLYKMIAIKNHSEANTGDAFQETLTEASPWRMVRWHRLVTPDKRVRNPGHFQLH